MQALDLARWQFAITTVYHFIFVPLTIGSAFLVAILQTAWVKTGNENLLRATKFFGKLFLINFAMGVVTGIVQEFQFGMNWSTYSRFVGDIFGAPLAVEGLAAFFLESTFLGLWIFGWDRLPKKVHLATIWMAALGTLLSAYFILAANAWMQHPVGYIINEQSGRAELTDFAQVLFQNTAVASFLHTIPAAFFGAGALFAGVGAWMVIRNKSAEVGRPAMKLGMISVIVAFVALFTSGDVLSKIMTEQQPMKMAAAEALYETSAPAPFSIFTIGTLDGAAPIVQIEIPYLLSFLSTGDFEGEVQGINDLQRQYEEQYGVGDYTPNIPMAYWSFRLMIGFGAIATLFALIGLWVTRKNQVPKQTWFLRSMIWMPFLPILASSLGWIFTETARQPWIVFGLMKTADGVSPTVSATSLLITLLGFTALYGILAVVELGLMLRAIKVGPEPAKNQDPYAVAISSEDKPLTFAY